jgi:phage terminase large subunit
VAVKEIVIPYEPRDVFLPFHDRTERFAVGVAHRRCGKTVACINDKIKRAIISPKTMYRAGYIAPYLKQAKDVAWEYLKTYSRPVWGRDPNESELWVELLNGARIRIYGADNAEALRGGYFDDATLDEYADMAPSVWGSIIRPMLADRRGSATFIGTPKGRNAFHQIFERAQSDPDWFTFMLRASTTGLLGDDELAAARLDMTPEQYEQEFECSFDAAIVGAYYGKEIAQAEREGRIRDVDLEPHAPVHTAWDLGFGDSTAIWFFQIVGNEIHVIDHYENNNHPLTHYLGVLKDRGYDYGTDFVPHDAKVRELIAGRTRVEFLSDNGRTLRVIPQHRVEDGINAGRLLVAKPTTFFDRTKCAQGLEALRQYRTEFDEKTRAFKNNPRHDWTSHTADAFRYLALGWRELDQPSRPRDPIAEMIKPKTFADMIREHELETMDE